jgi:hypothetical protein
VKNSPRIHQAGDFSAGLAPVQDPISRKWGYINTLGDYSIRPQFEAALPFHEGFAGVMLNDLWGFINRRGQWRVNPVYFRFSSFESGLAPVLIKKPEAPLKESKSAYIDKTGKLVIAANYDDVSPFYGGLAWVLVGDMSGYIDETGTYIWKPTK